MNETQRTVLSESKRERAKAKQLPKKREEREKGSNCGNKMGYCYAGITSRPRSSARVTRRDEGEREGERREEKRRRAERADDRQNMHAGARGSRVRGGWEYECGATGRWVRRNVEIVEPPGSCSPGAHCCCRCCRR